MTLEEFTAQLNARTFWKEFTFSSTTFSPPAKSEVELADGLVKIGPLAFVFQLKQREKETADPDKERNWFQRKVLQKAVSQIRDSLAYLREHTKIDLTNDQGHGFKVAGAQLQEIMRVIVYQGGRALPEDCRQTKHYVSKTAGFIHVVAAHDYLGILDKLRVPDDVRLYFQYREAVLPILADKGAVVEEPDIMVGFLSEQDLPKPNSKQQLQFFVQDLDEFDLSPIMRNLQEHIVNPAGGTEYYRMMEEFARVPRSIWRAFKQRFNISFQASASGQPQKPFRFAFPKTDCTFMIASLDPSWPSTGEDGLRMRSNAVAMFTEAAKYDLKTNVGVGLVISKDGEFYHMDWCLVEGPWETDPRIEQLLSDGLFRPAKEKSVDSFLFRGDASESI